MQETYMALLQQFVSSTLGQFDCSSHSLANTSHQNGNSLCKVCQHLMGLSEAAHLVVETALCKGSWYLDA